MKQLTLRMYTVWTSEAGVLEVWTRYAISPSFAIGDVCRETGRNLRHAQASLKMQQPEGSGPLWG